MSDPEQELINQIANLYSGKQFHLLIIGSFGDTNKCMVILIHISHAKDSEPAMRSLEQLRRWHSLGCVDGFRAECDQIYANHSLSLHHAREQALPEVQARSLRPIDRVISILDSVDGVLDTPTGRAMIYCAGAIDGMIMAPFIPLVLGTQIGIAVFRWWRGDLTGEEAAERVVRASVSAVGACTGFLAGFGAGGAILGPIGAAVGGGVGAVVGTLSLDHVFKRFRSTIFSGTGNDALNRAYRYFNLEPTCTNAEVNIAYEQKCMRTHPSCPGGSTEAQAECDTYFAVIRIWDGNSHDLLRILYNLGLEERNSAGWENSTKLRVTKMLLSSRSPKETLAYLAKVFPLTGDTVVGLANAASEIWPAVKWDDDSRAMFIPASCLLHSNSVLLAETINVLPPCKRAYVLSACEPYYQANAVERYQEQHWGNAATMDSLKVCGSIILAGCTAAAVGAAAGATVTTGIAVFGVGNLAAGLGFCAYDKFKPTYDRWVDRDEVGAACKNLGVDRNYTRREIDMAYKLKMRCSHPDKGGSVDDACLLTNSKKLLLERLDTCSS